MIENFALEFQNVDDSRIANWKQVNLQIQIFNNTSSIKHYIATTILLLRCTKQVSAESVSDNNSEEWTYLIHTSLSLNLLTGPRKSPSDPLQWTGILSHSTQTNTVAAHVYKFKKQAVMYNLWNSFFFFFSSRKPSNILANAREPWRLIPSTLMVAMPSNGREFSLESYPVRFAETVTTPASTFCSGRSHSPSKGFI